MRRYIYIFGLTVLFWGTSCADFINIQPENATTYSNYYKNEKELDWRIHTVSKETRRS